MSNNGPAMCSRIVLRDLEVLRAPFERRNDLEDRVRFRQDGDFAAMLKVTDTQVQKLHWVFTAAKTGTSSSARAPTRRTARRTSRAGTRCCARACARSSSTTRAWRGSPPSAGEQPMDNDTHPHLRHGLLRRPRPPSRGLGHTIPTSTSSAGARTSPRRGRSAGGHLQVVLHATRVATPPGATSSPRSASTRGRRSILVASGEASALLEDALEADVADVLLLPQLTENVVFAIRKAAHAGRRLAASGGRARRPRSSPCSRRRAARARP